MLRFDRSSTAVGLMISALLVALSACSGTSGDVEEARATAEEWMVATLNEVLPDVAYDMEIRQFAASCRDGTDARTVDVWLDLPDGVDGDSVVRAIRQYWIRELGADPSLNIAPDGSGSTAHDVKGGFTLRAMTFNTTQELNVTILTPCFRGE